AWGARLLPQIHGPQADLAEFFAHVAREEPTRIVRRLQSAMADGVTAGSDHIARLWANDRVLELMRTGGSRADAVALAARYRLVTPVSGAVVLESKQQYDAALVTPVSQAIVATLSEAHERALILTAC